MSAARQTDAHASSVGTRTRVGVVCLMVLAFFAFYANEARKEIYFLCSNFDEGHAYSTVVRQLSTANLSQFTVEQSGRGARIVHSSKLTFHLVSCTIDLDQHNKVVSVLYQ